MAKKSKINKNNKRIAMAAKFATVRAELKETIRSPKTSAEKRDAAAEKLRALPRDSSATRVRNRCFMTGRARGFYAKFGLCRNMLRMKAFQGELPGVSKASW